jgi:hypothetical protein
MSIFLAGINPKGIVRVSSGLRILSHRIGVKNETGLASICRGADARSVRNHKVYFAA